MKLVSVAMVVGAVSMLAACDPKGINKTYDGGIDSKPLSQLQAGIWIDPEGCDHWIIDDGVEGYLSARLDASGKPVCSGAGDKATAVGGFKSGSPIGDPW